MTKLPLTFKLMPPYILLRLFPIRKSPFSVGSPPFEIVLPTFLLASKRSFLRNAKFLHRKTRASVSWDPSRRCPEQDQMNSSKHSLCSDSSMKDQLHTCIKLNAFLSYPSSCLSLRREGKYNGNCTLSGSSGVNKAFRQNCSNSNDVQDCMKLMGERLRQM